MLSFFSGNTRVVNTKRAVIECLELAMGADYSNADLLIFHAAIGHDFKEIMTYAKALAPNAHILAASCCGVVGREGVSETTKDIALMGVKGTEFAITSINEIYGHNSYAKCWEMAKELHEKAPDVNMIYFMASGIDIDNNNCIRAIESVFGKDITIFGATSSDNMKGVFSYQGVDGDVYEHGAYLLGFRDPSLSVATQATHGFLAIGDPMVVTKSEGNVIEELNGKPAWLEYTHRLGLTEDATCGETIPIGALGEKLPPDLAAEYGNSHILRVVTKKEGYKMHYATECLPGTKLWLTVRDEALIFREMDRIVKELCRRVEGKEVVAVFHADCLARGKFLFNRVMKEELVSKMQTPFMANGQLPPWLGMYGFGEFAKLGGLNTFHNYTTALYVIYRH